ncbi:class I SAM-dependent methyltransferase [Salinibacter altiplanensis]|uniref:class I SAM-dependent methyltransferase n=1 Tax=Salinibacter altiplanensis TaxID=1803181 RepID=UPI000C9ECEE3|nr:methyltransferase domain-containing protein [Salinibacter altiplanensis]
MSSSFPDQKASVPDQYDGWARIYDFFWRRYMNQTLPVAQQTAAVEPGERVLDLACGTGELLHRIALDTPAAELTGVDLAPAMVERARTKLAGEADVRIEKADAHGLPFDDGAFDVIVCASTFHYFTHPQAVLEEVHRVLRPSGRFVVLDWCRDYWTCRTMDALLQRVDPAYETCYTLEELKDRMRPANFEVQDAFRYRFDLVWGMMGAEARTPPRP